MKKIAALMIVTALVTIGVLPFAVRAADTEVVVHPGDMQGWSFVDDNGGPTEIGEMVNGPAVPPMGTGSARLSTPSASDGVILVLPEYQGTALSSITNLEYSTYRTAGGPALAAALQFNVDSDLTDGNLAWQGRLVYEPYYTQTVNTGVWQTWDPQNDAAGTGTGNWWFSNGTLSTLSGCTIATPCTWAEVLAAFPNAGIHSTLGAVLFKAGGNWAGFDGNVDAFTIGVGGNNTTYDFELDEPAPEFPTTKDECKNEGWKTFTAGFKNQGQCIKYVNTGKL